MRHARNHPAYTVHQYEVVRDKPHGKWYSLSTYYGKSVDMHLYGNLAHYISNKRHRPVFSRDIRLNQKVARAQLYTHKHFQQHMIGERGSDEVSAQFEYLDHYYQLKSKGYRLP
jgi:hypothetical protein